MQSDSEIIRFPNAIGQDGRYTLVIGDNPSGDGQIVLRILNGVIISAGQLIEDPTGKYVEIDRTDEHPVRDDGSHITDYDVIEQIVRSPDQIYQNGQNRLYVKQIDGRWYTVRTYDHPGESITVGTTVIYESRGELEQFLDRKDYPEIPIYESD